MVRLLQSASWFRAALFKFKIYNVYFSLRAEKHTAGFILNDLVWLVKENANWTGERTRAYVRVWILHRCKWLCTIQQFTVHIASHIDEFSFLNWSMASFILELVALEMPTMNTHLASDFPW